MISKRQENFQNAIECKLRVQGWASERLQDQIIEGMKEMEHTKTEEAFQLVRKGQPCGCTKMKKKKQKDCRAPGNQGRMRKWPGRHHERCQNGQTGKRRVGWKKANGGWSLKEKQKCQK